MHAFVLTAAASPGMLSNLTTLLPFVVLIVVFYFFLIRPENKKKKTVAEMRKSLSVGTTITTIGGIVGKIVNIKDDEITIETGADEVRFTVMRWAISATGASATE
ncbi:MAG: preprotein translocase subunit YajC [Oscillospiraceae bacterium]|jgi:preprotein translocase subunit YajC|nr:preprotein translocase subunit YajC [Oscillospiraceae bacterium]